MCARAIHVRTLTTYTHANHVHVQIIPQPQGIMGNQVYITSTNIIFTDQVSILFCMLST